MIEAYARDEEKKFILELTSVKDIKIFRQKITENKDRLLTLAIK